MTLSMSSTSPVLSVAPPLGTGGAFVSATTAAVTTPAASRLAARNQRIITADLPSTDRIVLRVQAHPPADAGGSPGLGEPPASAGGCDSPPGGPFPYGQRYLSRAF